MNPAADATRKRRFFLELSRCAKAAAAAGGRDRYWEPGRSLPARRMIRTTRSTIWSMSITVAPAQREVRRSNLTPISDLRLTIVPDRHGPGPAKLSSLRLFAAESRSDT